MELGNAKEIEARFSELAEEVNAVLNRIKQREIEEHLRRKRETYSAPRPRNIYKQISGRSDFEYIKVPKQPPFLSFGSKTDRMVFPNLPGIISKNGQMMELHLKQPRKVVMFDNSYDHQTIKTLANPSTNNVKRSCKN